MTDTLKIVFAGTPEFAVPSLQALIDSPHQVAAVYTQPDRPSGRGRRLTASPVKRLAAAHRIPVHQPTSLKKAVEQERLQTLDPDLMVVAAYGLILPAAVLAIPRRGCLNVHASLLPRWRGASPIAHAILAGDDVTGITIIQMNAALDAGAMLSWAECPIEPHDTAQSLHDRLSTLGALTLMDALNRLLHNESTPAEQAPERVTYAPKLDKTAAEVDWQQPAQRLERMIRAYNPWPMAYTYLEDAPLRLWRALVINGTAVQPPGTVLSANREGIDVACGEGVLRLTCIQRPGGRPLEVDDYLNAHPIRAGIRLGKAAPSAALHQPSP
jgi:methionyl-tRNA formyltransferase